LTVDDACKEFHDGELFWAGEPVEGGLIDLHRQ
jgi:hypothetical protein